MYQLLLICFKYLIIKDITSIGKDIPTQFVAFEAGQWILDWAEYAVQHFDNGPYVWSISYGFPESMLSFLSYTNVYISQFCNAALLLQILPTAQPDSVPQIT